MQHLSAGRLDIGFLRPPVAHSGLKHELRFHETLRVAMPAGHVLADRSWIDVHDLASLPMIVPARPARPHSFKAVLRAFADAGEELKIAFEATERQTMISLVASGVGLAIVPSWAEKFSPPGVIYRPRQSESATDFPESALVPMVRDAAKRGPGCVLDLVRSHLASLDAPGAVAHAQRAMALADNL